MNVEMCRRALLSVDEKREQCGNSPPSNDGDEPTQNDARTTQLQKEFKRHMMSALCNVPLDRVKEDAEPVGLLRFGMKENHPQSLDPFSLNPMRVLHDLEGLDKMGRVRSTDDKMRKIPTSPDKVLHAPGIIDDFYLNLMSWGQNNVLAVALGNSVNLWNATTGEVHELFERRSYGDYVTSISWCPIPGHAKFLAIGTRSSLIEIWDTEAMVRVRAMFGCSGRIFALAWNQHWLTWGGEDSLIRHCDLRSHSGAVSIYRGHAKKICGLKWNDGGTCLASGGDDNNVCLWDSAMSAPQRRPHVSSMSLQGDVAPRLVLKQHKAAVKAMDWCPTNRGLLATGGGNDDRTIKLWNTNSGKMLSSVNAKSQVTSIVWSKYRQELVSSHGWSDNHLALWKYGAGSGLTKLKDIKSHSSRILDLACSPDGSTIVSASADETLRMWSIFGTCPRSRSSMDILRDVTFGVPQIR